MYSSLLRSFVTDVIYAIVLAALRERYYSDEVRKAVEDGVREAFLDFESEEAKQRAGH